MLLSQLETVNRISDQAVVVKAALRAADRLGIDIAVVDRMLNHVATATTSKIARIYNMSELFEPRRQASNAWAALLESEVIGDASANVL